MNSNWKQTFDILNKEERLIIGLMSGTSLDGLDIALCKIKGSGIHTEAEVLCFKTVSYDEQFKADVKEVFSKRTADLQKVCLLNESIGILHAGMILEALAEWGVAPSEVDLIASHGQTIFHAPKSLHQLEGYPDATLQIGDGDHIAVKTGIMTLCDFRQKHIAAGGEGAPLAVYGDYLIFSKAGENRVMLNIGGIANFTYLPGTQDASKVFSTDVGPGNTLMDQFVQKNYKGLYFDEDARIARSGKLNEALLAELLKCDFFEALIPKTTGPELFNLDYLYRAQQASGTTGMAAQDVLATLCHFSAKTISDAIGLLGAEQVKVFMSGGGMHNPLLVDLLRKAFPQFEFCSTDDLGINPDAKEALLFAILANETLFGEPVNFSGRTGIPSVTMGKICFPH